MQRLALLTGLLVLVASSTRAAVSYRVNRGTTVSITEHGVCRQVTNNSSGDLFVPTRTAAEWSSFYDRLPPGVVARPCLSWAPIPLTDGAPWIEAAVDPRSPSTIYAENMLGMVYRSSDAGLTWTVMCRNPTYSSVGAFTTMLLVSPASDRNAYVTSHTRVYRVGYRGGAACLDATLGLGAVYGYYSTSSLAVSPNTGHLYALEWPNKKLLKSTDFGASWAELPSNLSSSAYMGWITIDPRDEGHMLVVRTFAGTPEGLFRRTSPTAPFVHVAPAVNGIHQVVKFDPVRPGWVYANGYVSSTNAATWTASTAHQMSNDWAIDAAGAGYSLQTPGSGSTVLRRATDMRSPIWTQIASFPGSGPYSHVDVGGTTIAVVVAARLYVSTNSGASFREVPPVIGGSSLASLETLDGQTLVGTSAAGRVMVSKTAGTSWQSRFSVGDIDPNEARARVMPSDGRNILVYAEDPSGSTYNQTIAVSHDEMVTATQSQRGVYSWGTAVAMSPVTRTIYMFGMMNSQVSTNAGDTFTSLPANPWPNVWLPSAAVISPVNDNRVWVLEPTYWRGRLDEYDHVTRTVTDITARATASVGGGIPAGMELFSTGGSSFTIRLIGTTGGIGRSNDGGVTFAAAATTGGLASCNWRFLTSRPQNRSVLATSCRDNGLGLGVSLDGGNVWEPVGNGASACRVLGVALTRTAVVAACRDTPPLYAVHTPNVCGDGVVELPERCDQGAGNGNAPNACRSDCQPARCGDGVRDTGEQCDDGNTNDYDGCTSSCTVCGNSVITAPETCDAGGGNSNAPNATCRTNCQPRRCGDGIVDSGEVCDDGNAVGGDGCRWDCRGREVCGDGVADFEAGEGCDNGAANSNTAPDACRTTCRSARCGDGVRDSGEGCDDGNLVNTDACTNACMVNVSTEPRCTHEDDDFDGIIDEGCGASPAPAPTTSWQPYDFSYHGFQVGCSGARRIRSSGYSVGRVVGVILCSPTRYKIMLGESAAGPFYSIGDGAGSGEDHCEFVGGTYSAMSSGTSSGQPGYMRASAGQTPTFGTMSGAHYTGSWYQCGVSIP